MWIGSVHGSIEQEESKKLVANREAGDCKDPFASDDDDEEMD